jgi:hypothetical protein
MEDKPLLHPGQLNHLVLEYLFGDGHRESFPKRNPSAKTLNMAMTKVRKSIIERAFPDGQLLTQGASLCLGGVEVRRLLEGRNCQANICQVRLRIRATLL